MEIVGLNVYPIKACRGTVLEQAVLDAQGIRFDRRWMIVHADSGRFITQRESPELSRIVPTVSETGTLSLTFDSLSPLSLPYQPDPALAPVTVTVWGFTGEALDCGHLAAEWLSAALGSNYRLVRTPEMFTRRVNPTYARPDDRVGFADGYPLLLASLASLDDLNARLLERGAEPVPMNRFRPNIVVRGTSAWEEDHWKVLAVQNSDLTFRVAKPCARCAVTTIDQFTSEKTGVEPLATLARFRRDADGKVNFATNLIHDRSGDEVILRLGDHMLQFE
jgi:uncharacterized protein YcbX